MYATILLSCPRYHKVISIHDWAEFNVSVMSSQYKSFVLLPTSLTGINEDFKRRKDLTIAQQEESSRIRNLNVSIPSLLRFFSHTVYVKARNKKKKVQSSRERERESNKENYRSSCKNKSVLSENRLLLIYFL